MWQKIKKFFFQALTGEEDVIDGETFMLWKNGMPFKNRPACLWCGSGNIFKYIPTTFFHYGKAVSRNSEPICLRCYGELIDD